MKSKITKGERSLLSEPGPSAAPLPQCLRLERRFHFDTAEFDLRSACLSLLRRVHACLGSFPDGRAPRLEEFQPAVDVFRNFKARQMLYQAVAEDTSFLDIYEKFVITVVLPFLKLLLNEHHSHVNARNSECVVNTVGAGRTESFDLSTAAPSNETDGSRTHFFYQYPPSLRLQPGPSEQFGRVHRDVEYGHQPGEINFWLPLTDYSLTRTCLWVESSPGSEDFHPVDVPYGFFLAFHGSLCRHHVPPNPSSYTRVSMDFRVGVDRFFDSTWHLKTAKAQHGRRDIYL